MASLDWIEFLQALLTTFFLASLSVLIPKFLAAGSQTTLSMPLSCFLDNLYRHNPFQQWMAERQLARSVAAANLRGLDEQKRTFLSRSQCNSLICPNKKWLLVSMTYVFIYVLVSVAGALTIMWQESVAVPPGDPPTSLYPAFPVDTGLTLMTVRGNCKWTMVKGSGDVDKAGFVIYQLCLDVFPYERNKNLRKNEVRAISHLNGTQHWKMTWSLETLTQHGIDEHWRVSPDNEERLELARPEKDYLKNCDEECLGRFRDKGIEYAMIFEALKEVGMVQRRLQHYDEHVPDFVESDVLRDRKNRLRVEAWIAMLGVTVVALLWSFVGVITSDGETDFAMVTRLTRLFVENGPKTMQTVLQPGTEQNHGFAVTTRTMPTALREMLNPKKNKNSGKVRFVDSDGNNWIKSSDIHLNDEEAGEVVLRVAEYTYGIEQRERAKDGMIFLARRAKDEDEETDDDFEDSDEENPPTPKRVSEEQK